MLSILQNSHILTDHSSKVLRISQFTLDGRCIANGHDATWCKFSMGIQVIVLKCDTYIPLTFASFPWVFINETQRNTLIPPTSPRPGALRLEEGCKCHCNDIDRNGILANTKVELSWKQGQL